MTHAVRFLSGVDAQVALQGLQVAEAGAAGVAGVGLLAGVDQDVGSQVSHLKPGQNPQFTTRNPEPPQKTGRPRSPERTARHRCHSGTASPPSGCGSESSGSPAG